MTEYKCKHVSIHNNSTRRWSQSISAISGSNMLPCAAGSLARSDARRQRRCCWQRTTQEGRSCCATLSTIPTASRWVSRTGKSLGSTTSSTTRSNPWTEEATSSQPVRPSQPCRPLSPLTQVSAAASSGHFGKLSEIWSVIILHENIEWFCM